MSISPPISLYTEKDMLQMNMFELENERNLITKKINMNKHEKTQCRGRVFMGNEIIEWLDENYQKDSNDETHEFFILTALSDYLEHELNYLNAVIQDTSNSNNLLNLRRHEIQKEIKGLKVQLNALDENVQKYTYNNNNKGEVKVVTTTETTVRDEYDKSMIGLKEAVHELNQEVQNVMGDMNEFSQLLKQSTRFTDLNLFKQVGNTIDIDHFGSDYIHDFFQKMNDAIKKVENTEYFKNENKPIDEDMKTKLIAITDAVQEVREEATCAFDEVEAELQELDEMKDSVPYLEGESIRSKIATNKDVSESEAQEFIHDVESFINQNGYGVSIENYSVNEAFDKLETQFNNIKGE